MIKYDYQFLNIFLENMFDYHDANDANNNITNNNFV